jgi:hypothetical protein
MDSMDNPANFAIEPSFSEHSEEFKNRFSMNSSASKLDSNEQSILGKLDNLMLMQSKFQNNLFDSLSQSLENLMSDRFENILKEKLEEFLVQSEYKNFKFSSSKIVKFAEGNEFDEKIRKKKTDLREKFEEIIEKNRDFEVLVRENEKLRNEKNLLEKMNESMRKVHQDLKESLIQEKSQKEKFIHLFFETRKQLKNLNEIVEVKEQENLENLSKLQEQGKKIQNLNEENLEILNKHEEKDRKIQILNQEIKNLQNLASSQKGKILKLKRVKREDDVKTFKKILVNHSDHVLEVKKKVEELHQKILSKIGELEACHLDETKENLSVIHSNQFEYLDYLKNYSEIIEKQIFDFEVMEKDMDDSDNIDELLARFQEKNQSFNEEKGLLDFITLSSDDD